MVDWHDQLALHWVRGAVDESLEHARQALEGGQLQLCHEVLHQVHGALQMTECHGAVLLAQECEALALALIEGRTGEAPGAVRWLRQALVQLPLYLDRLQLARRDLPLVVLPLINDLRSARGEAGLPQSGVFSPLLASPEALPDSSLPAEQRGPGPDALRSVLRALCEELVRVKQRLDTFMHGDRSQPGELADLLPVLRQVADALAVLGFGQPRKVIIDQLGVVQGLAQGSRAPDDGVLLDVAGALLYVEATLGGMNAPADAQAREGRQPSTDLRHVQQVVINETRAGLQQVQDLLLNYIEGHWARDDLQALPALLVQLHGALQMVAQSRAAAILHSCNDYIQAHMLSGPVHPAPAQLDRLADALCSVDYYLECLAIDPESPAESLLDAAQAALAALGYQPAVLEVPLLQPQPGPVDAMAQALVEVLARPAPALNPPARYVPASLLPPPAQEVPLDEELREVFLEEAAEVLEAFARYLPQWARAPHETVALGELRRGFHTLKGSGRMVRALVLAELAWAAENLLNRVIEQSVGAQRAVLQLTEEIVAALPLLIDDFAAGRQHQCDAVDLLAARAHALAKGEDLALDDAAPVSATNAEQAHDPQLLEIFHTEAVGHLTSLNRFLAQDEVASALPVSDELQRALHTLKGSAFVAGVLPIGELAAALDLLAREFRAHQLALQADELQSLETAEYLIRQKLLQLPGEPLAPIPGGAALIATIQQQVQQRLAEAPAADAPNRRRDPQLIASFLAQGMDILLDAEALLRRWRQRPGERHELTTLLDELTTLGEGAHLADLMQVDELCEALLDLYGAVEESSLAVGEAFFAEAELAHDGLIGMLDQLAAGQQVQPRPDRVAALRQLLEQGLAPGEMGLVQGGGAGVTELANVTRQLNAGLNDEVAQLFVEESVDILEGAGQALQRWLSDPDNLASLAALQRDLDTLRGGAQLAGMPLIGELADQLAAAYEGLLQQRLGHSAALEQLLVEGHERLASMLDQLAQGQPLVEPLALIEAIQALRQAPPPAAEARRAETPSDSELRDIFIEEGLDIVESAGAALQRWQAEPANSLEVENLLRDLHTLKGGARMVEIVPLGDLAHELEFLYEQLSAGQLQPSLKLFSLLQKGHDRLAQMLDAVRSGQPLPDAAKLTAAIRDFGSQPQQPAPAASKPQVVEGAALERGPVDVVKVAADLLDDLGNLAGEASIIRGRVEQQANDARSALQEMEMTIERMRDQLRRLDTETQGRISSRQQSEQDYEDFDPLEMDRHSQLQQLSRALFESASDLLDLKETLASRNNEAQALLQQQARVNTALQEGLMRTRMVPFERLLPRLQRVVRQVAEELGKGVEFEVSDAQGEMDRSVLERMIAPLEHMLRNAVDHGLEPAEVRLAAGKPVQGLIRLALLHEGNDIVIEMSDDGAGVPLQAVRAKAVKRGLIEADSQLSDHDVLQFILQPGFSTATKVTQISGRGLGMDVVHEEVKQLGGSMSIDSRPGKGARFQIRLPFTVSVNRALMVQCGDDQYAIPLNSIEGIVRVPATELEACFQQLPARYQYGGRGYDLRYLAQLLHGTARQSLLGQAQPLPVLLVRAFDHQVAVQVDGLAGSREIVVKGLGSQFAKVPGLSGATILGDGRVVLILDLLAQIRADQARRGARPQGRPHAVPQAEVQPAPPLLVLVVDDSVTVRKVTSRLLERHGMQVLTARDGVDAMALLQEHTPDVLLLDIEMPRMDGFEVALQVRHDARLKELPIIMITSRTGQKHRERAAALGVNEYLGKPYQEAQLLDSIRQWSRQHA
jgi:chemosensory pili system protein ChpA (sensor histidine kinase/response regulator)